MIVKVSELRVAGWSVPQLYLDNIERTLAAAHPEQIERATTGRNSYREIHRRCHQFAASTWVPVEKAIGVTAVISPIITWEENIEQAEALCWESSSGDKPNVAITALPANVAKARRILAGESALDVIRGPKVWNFYWSIAHPDNPHTVCVDRHVARAAFGWDYGWRDTDTRLKSPGEYDTVAESVRRIAARHGMRALELQALLWLVMRENPRQGRLF